MSEQTRERVRSRTIAVDGAIAFALWVATAGFLILVVADPPYGGFLRDTLAMLGISTLLCVPLAFRRTHPVASYTVVSLACLLQILLLNNPLPADAAYLVATYTVSAYAPQAWARWGALGVAVMSGMVGIYDWGYTRSVDSLITFAVQSLVFSGAAVVCWVLGDVVGRRRVVIARLEEQNSVLRRERDQRAQLAAQQERTRIAREMHDVVAHSLSVIVVQADGAAYAAENAPDWKRADAARAIDTIASTARTSLADVRRLVGVLREAGSDAEYAPGQSIDDIPELVDGVRSAGNDVDLTMTGTEQVASLAPEVGLAAYRIVQEALTNVIKHGGPHARTQVSVAAEEGQLRIEVLDNGRGAAADPRRTTLTGNVGTAAGGAGGDAGGGAGGDSGGHGLIGMVERATALGGGVTAGPRPGGGWRVRASMPIRTGRL